MRISDWSSDVCSSDLRGGERVGFGEQRARRAGLGDPLDVILAPLLAGEEEGQAIDPTRKGRNEMIEKQKRQREGSAPQQRLDGGIAPLQEIAQRRDPRLQHVGDYGGQRVCWGKVVEVR